MVRLSVFWFVSIMVLLFYLGWIVGGQVTRVQMQEEYERAPFRNSCATKGGQIAGYDQDLCLLPNNTYERRK